MPRSSGAIVKGGYGHASVYDPKTKKIYVYAGYHSGSSAAYYLSNHMYSYDPQLKYWLVFTRPVSSILYYVSNMVLKLHKSLNFKIFNLRLIYIIWPFFIHYYGPLL